MSLFFAFLLSILAPLSARAEALSLDAAFGTPNILGTTPSPPAWSPDSRHLAFTWNEAGRPRRGLWIAARDGTGLERLASATAASVRDVAWMPGSDALLFLRGDGLWKVAIAGGRGQRVTTVGEGAADLTVAPGGNAAAFLRDGDLWLADLATKKVRRLTRVGIASLSALPLGRYSRPEREIGPGIWGGPTYRWSPDGRHIAVHHVDRRRMRRVPFPDYLADETNPNEVRRGYPGDANESRDVGIVDVAAGSLRLLGLEAPDSRQIVDFAWSPEGALLIDRATDTAVDRRLLVLQPGEDQVEEIWHSRRESRIYTSFGSAWHPDGERVIVLDDRSDRYGLYLVDPANPTAEVTRLSAPAHDALSAPMVDHAGRQVFYEGNGPTPYEQHVYRAPLDGGSPERLTTVPGRHDAYPSPDGQSLAVIRSDDVTPPDLYVKALDDRALTRVTRSPTAAFEAQDWVRARYVSFPSLIDDYVLHARILEPAELEPGRRYPVVFGPAYSNTARNTWRGVYSLVQQMLVQRGYIVAQVDVRGSTGYGRAFREEFLTDFAGEDIEDLASAVAYMKTLDHVDAERFGIWGSSYGGTLTAYSLLTKPGLFHAGVAAASAVDPYFFGTDDVAIVRRPATAPEIFERAARRHAAKLEDHLLLMHGMQDHVVPFKTVAVLADELIRQGKDFDFAVAPGATHAWSREAYYSRYLFGKLFDHFDRHLRRDAPADP